MSIHEYNRVWSLLLAWKVSPDCKLTQEEKNTITHFMEEVRKKYVLKNKTK